MSEIPSEIEKVTDKKLRTSALRKENAVKTHARFRHLSGQIFKPQFVDAAVAIHRDTGPIKRQSCNARWRVRLWPITALQDRGASAAMGIEKKQCTNAVTFFNSLDKEESLAKVLSFDSIYHRKQRSVDLRNWALRLALRLRCESAIVRSCAVCSGI